MHAAISIASMLAFPFNSLQNRQERVTPEAAKGCCTKF
jgi:hypothetical protein